MEIIHENDFPDFIKAQLAKVNEGVWEARKAGLNVQMPEAVQFDVIVIRKWQPADLAIIGTDSSQSKDTGTSTQNGSGRRESQEGSTSTRTSQDNGNSNSTTQNYTFSNT